jgi:dephospho-CoA kinase
LFLLSLFCVSSRWWENGFLFSLQVIARSAFVFFCVETLMAGWLSNGLCQRVVQTTAPPSLQVERFEICKQRRKKLLDHYD